MTLVIPESATGASGARGEGGGTGAETAGGARPGPTCPSCGARFPADALFCSLDGSPLTTSPSVIAAAAATDPYLGREILGHIEIRQLVGIGAMGRVYRAFQKGIDRDVAVKVLHRELSSNTTLVARFDREAKVASRLAHPNVVHVLLVGQLPDGAMYIVMEYLDGLSLQSALAAVEGAMPLPRALHIALQLCDAAGEGHAQGIVHRDLKPENVMLVRRADDPDFVKVLDFGIARVHWGEQSMATAAGLIFGTARYISPEGAQGEQVGPQGDVYSIATMLYQMLSGRTPFNAEQAVALLVQQIHDAPPPLEGIARSAYVPEPIAAVIMRNLSKKPADRAADGRAFGRALLEAAVTSGLSAQDVLARPSLTGGARGSATAVQMPSMQRTRQMQLDPETAARMGATTAYETPAPSVVEGRAQTHTEIADPFAVPPGMATTKWAAVGALEARLSTPPPSPVQSPAPSGVEETMDDRHSARSQTLPLSAPIDRGADRAADRQSGPPEARSSRTPTVADSRSSPTGPGALSSRTPAPPSKPPSGVDVTIAGDPVPAAAQAPASRSVVVRGALIGGVCFLVGALGMVGVAWKTALLGTVATQAVPPGPAVRLPPPLALQARAPEVEPQALPPLDPLVLARPQAVQASAAQTMPSSTSPAAAAQHAVLEASNAAPGVGQPVDFEARLVPARDGRLDRVDGAHFVIAGPGVAPGTELSAPDDGTGVFRTTFTFLQDGRFEIAFSARVDKAIVRGNRVVVVGDGKGAPASSAAGESPASPPSNTKVGGGANAKWL